MRPQPRILTFLVLAYISLFGYAMAQVAIPPKIAAVNKAKPHTLLMQIQRVNGRLEAQFTNNTKKDLGVTLGKDHLRLKPGENGKILIPVRKILKIYEFDKEPKKFKSLIASMISPKPTKIEFLIPK